MSPWSTPESLRLLGGRSSVRLRGVDLVLFSACSLAALLLLGPARWAPGALPSAVFFMSCALGLLGLRILEATWPQQPLWRWMGDFWLLPTAGMGHEWLNPLVDAFTPLVRDARLVAIEDKLFGVQVSVLVSNAVPHWLMDVLMVCYYGHFVWALALGLTLYVHKRLAAFDEFLLALGLFFALDYVAYTLVPAVGPRFFMPSAFAAPLTGVLVTPFLEELMRAPRFFRDCFPSGHTGTTLLVFFYSFRFARRFFWIVLLPGLGLITATLAGRFHYATDLVAVVPLVVVVVGLAMALSRSASRRQHFASERSVPMDAIVRP